MKNNIQFQPQNERTNGGLHLLPSYLFRSARVRVSVNIRRNGNYCHSVPPDRKEGKKD